MISLLKLKAVLLTSVALVGCVPAPIDEPTGEGPGGRPQPLALTPERELEVGREAYREILSDADVLPEDSPETDRVRRVGERIAGATRIEPLMREIHLRDAAQDFEWEFNVIRSDRVNAFCLPAGKVGVYTGLLDFVRDDDELATVLGHEIAHALAHHASERLALNPGDSENLRASAGKLDRLTGPQRKSLLSMLSPGATLDSLAYNRFQESEADHIGVFLMTFAGFNPEEALGFWDRMRLASSGSLRLPEILSDHPADGRRIAQLRQWIPLAEGAQRAFDRGEVAGAGER
jgi:predicted Zn-dependent protease